MYADSTAVVGPLATMSEPHSWDLCGFHSARMTVPHGWEMVRSSTSFAQAAGGSSLVSGSGGSGAGGSGSGGGHTGSLFGDDLGALAETVREPGPGPGSGPRFRDVEADTLERLRARATRESAPDAVAFRSRRRGHLRVLPDPPAE